MEKTVKIYSENLTLEENSKNPLIAQNMENLVVPENYQTLAEVNAEIKEKFTKYPLLRMKILYDISVTCACYSCKYIMSKNPSVHNLKMVNNFQNLSSINNDSMDLVNIAYLAMYEELVKIPIETLNYWYKLEQKLKDGLELNSSEYADMILAKNTMKSIFLKACNMVKNSLYGNNKMVKNTENTKLYNNLIIARKILKHQKVEVSTAKLEEIASMIADKNVTLVNIDSLIEEEKLHRKVDYVPRKLYIEDTLDENGENGIYSQICVNSEIDRLLEKSGENELINSFLKEITPRQAQILKYRSYGWQDLAIAEKVGCSMKTVSGHMSRIREVALKFKDIDAIKSYRRKDYQAIEELMTGHKKVTKGTKFLDKLENSHTAIKDGNFNIHHVIDGAFNHNMVNYFKWLESHEVYNNLKVGQESEYTESDIEYMDNISLYTIYCNKLEKWYLIEKFQKMVKKHFGK
jgi:transposase